MTRIKLILLSIIWISGINAQIDTSKINSINERAAIISRNNLDSAIVLSESALNLIPGSSQQAKILKADQLNLIGDYYDSKGNFTISMDYFQQELVLRKKIKNKYKLAKLYGNIGLSYLNQGDYPNSLDFLFKALKLNERLKHKPGILVNLGNIGIVYDYLGEFDKSLEFYEKTLELAKLLKQKHSISTQYGNIGIIHSRLKNYEKAREYFHDAIKIDSNLNDVQAICRNLGNIGQTYVEIGDYEKALKFNFQSLEISQNNKLKFYEAVNYANLGNVFIEMKKFKEAEESLLKGIDISREINSRDLSMSILDLLSYNFESAGHFEKAFDFYRQYIALRDSIYNEQNTAEKTAIELNYQFEKQNDAQQSGHLKERQKLIMDKKIQSQWNIFLLICTILVIFLLFFAFRAYRIKKKHAYLLSEEDKRKEIMLEEVHHRINNNLQIISSLLSLQASSVNDEKLNTYLTQSQSRIQSLAALHNLLNHSTTPLQVDIKDYLQELIKFHEDLGDNKKNHITYNLDLQSLLVSTKIAVPVALIVNELITNSIKYAFPVRDGEITLSLLPIDEVRGKWKIIISDNGIGLPDKENYRKESLGLRLVGILCQQIGASILSDVKNGTEYQLTFSIS